MIQYLQKLALYSTLITWVATAHAQSAPAVYDFIGQTTSGTPMNVQLQFQVDQSGKATGRWFFGDGSLARGPKISGIKRGNFCWLSTGNGGAELNARCDDTRMTGWVVSLEAQGPKTPNTVERDSTRIRVLS
jgi:hypothetical protein